MQLQDELKRIRGAGLEVLAISYDKVEIIAEFSQRRNIGYPLLSDPGSKTIKAYGVLDLNEKEGRSAGIPQPSTFVIGPNGRVRSILRGKNYGERHTIEDLIAAAKP